MCDKIILNPLKIRVASYNIGDFSGEGYAPGSFEGKLKIKKAMSAVGAEIWALQEDVEFYNQDTKETAYAAIYSDYGYYERRGVKRYNYKAFLSNKVIKDVEQIYYVGDMKFAHPWFLRGTVNIGGRDVLLVSLHFDWTDKFVRAEEIKQVIDYAKKHEYAVVMGDFNTVDYVNKVKQSENNLYREEFKRFVDAGFKSANGGKSGTFNTYVEHKDNHYPLDNIFTWGNIEIVNVGMHLADYMNDHAIIWADLSFM